MSYHYAVLGAGRQGTAAAYDLAKHGDAARVVLADVNLEQAQAAAQRVNALLDTDIVEATPVNVTNYAAVVRLLRGIDALLSAVPYYYNLDSSTPRPRRRASASSPTAGRCPAWAPRSWSTPCTCWTSRER